MRDCFFGGSKRDNNNKSNNYNNNSRNQDVNVGKIGFDVDGNNKKK
ncbi:MAG: hypothetical protein R3Y29_05000 [bacterium]